MKSKKSTLITILILLVLFLPVTFFSTTLHFQNKNKQEENPNHDFFYNGKLYFYHNHELLGTYTCQNIDYCDYALSNTTSSFSLKEPFTEKNKISLIQNRYAFLMDTTTNNLSNSEVILYDVITNKEMGRYEEVKNYGIGISHENYIVKNKNGLWGVLQFYEGVNLKIPFAYDYIGLANQKSNEEKIDSDIFAVLKDNTWSLIDINNKPLTKGLQDNLITYNTEYLIIENQYGMQLLTHDGKNRLFGNYKYLDFCGNYIAIVENNNTFYLFDLINNKEIGNRYTIESPKDLNIEIVGERILVRVNDELIENIAIA